MLTPAEVVGLSGATLETRVRQAARQVTDAGFANVARRLAEDARANDIVYQHGESSETIRVMLRPLLVMPEQITYVHHVCTRILDALKRLPSLYFADPDVRRVLRISEQEEQWLRESWGPEHEEQNPIYGRLDAVCNFPSAGWRESLQFMEPNLSGVGGIHLSPLAEELVMRDVVPTLLAHDPGLEIERPRDQRELFLQLILDHAATLGPGPANIAFVEPKYDHGGSDEQPALIRNLRSRHAGHIVHADPRELRLEGERVFYEDVRIDVAYRDYETRDLIALGRREGHDLAAVRALFRQNRMVSPAGGDLDHKSAFELLTDDVLAERHFSPEERRIFDRHVLWTRVLGARKTGLPRGEGDLLEHVRSHRDDLVIKPNRGYGGEGIHIGRLTEQGAWEALIEEAIAHADDPDRAWVVQSATSLPVCELPVVDDRQRVHEEPFYVVMGFAPTDGGLGIVGRVSQKQVVNVAQRGGLVAVLVGYAPSELRAPVRSSPRKQAAFDKLRAQIADLRGLDAAIGLLGWDEETYLPEAGRPGRGEQLATLEGMRHRLLTADALGDLVEDVGAQTEPESREAAELRRLRRLRSLALALPDELVRALAQARSQCLARWEQARKTDDFACFAPSFVRLLGLVREKAQAVQRGEQLYDGLLDEYEPGMTRARLDPILRELRERLTPLAAKLAQRTARYPEHLPRGAYADAAQDALCREVLHAIGFDFARGRLDRSTHPFTLMAGEHDVRITMRTSPHDPLPALFSVLHEGGHALYDQGFDAQLHGTLLAEGPGMGIHESQSRLWENQVGRSRAFWTWLWPRMQAAFPAALATLRADDAYHVINVVRPGFCRVEADEVTYNLHVILRYELELELLDGQLHVEDLPGAWSEGSARLLGVRPGTALEGCLQDVHWALGSFGYFPTYALGNLYGAQLFEHFAGQHPGFDAELREGRMQSLLDYLREHVHRHGHRHEAEALVRRATGRGLDAEPFFRLLERKHEQR